MMAATMKRRVIAGLAGALMLGAGGTALWAAGHAVHPSKQHWSVDGIFGHFDRAATIPWRVERGPWRRPTEAGRRRHQRRLP